MYPEHTLNHSNVFDAKHRWIWVKSGWLRVNVAGLVLGESGTGFEASIGMWLGVAYLYVFTKISHAKVIISLMGGKLVLVRGQFGPKVGVGLGEKGIGLGENWEHLGWVFGKFWELFAMEKKWESRDGFRKQQFVYIHMMRNLFYSCFCYV